MLFEKLKEIKSRKEVAEITRVESWESGILRIYYTVNDEYAEANDLWYKDRVWEYNPKTKIQMEFADTKKVNFKEE